MNTFIVIILVSNVLLAVAKLDLASTSDIHFTSLILMGLEYSLTNESRLLYSLANKRLPLEISTNQ